MLLGIHCEHFLKILIYVMCLVDSVIKKLDMMIGKAMGASMCVICEYLYTQRISCNRQVGPLSLNFSCN